MKTTVYIATSLDGFIAKKDGDIDWLHKPEYMIDGEDMGFHSLMQSIDYLVMGSGTYEQVVSFEGGWPYGDTKVIVLSSRNLDIPADIRSTVRQMRGTPADIVAELAKSGAKHLYIDGGKTVQDFLAAGLIDELIITRLPVLLGEGIPLFGPIGSGVELDHVKTRSYSNGFVQSHYSVR